MKLSLSPRLRQIALSLASLIALALASGAGQRWH